MKSLSGFLFFLIIASAILQSVQAQNQSGFISLACGLIPKSATYTEKTTNISYISDANFIDSGIVGRIDDSYKTLFQQQTWTLRSFPEGQRNCYTFNLKENSKYLIRGTFVYGNYDGLNQIPEFDLHVGPNKWTSVTLKGVANASIYEIIHVVAHDRLQVCLIKTGNTTPFISSLELQKKNNNTYLTQSGSLMSFARIYFPQTPSFLRYYEDVHDRVWVPYINNETVSLSTNLTIDTSIGSYNVPQHVANCAIFPANASHPLNLWWDIGDTNAHSYIYMHFAEIQNLGSNEIREFNISYNGGEVWESFFRPHKLKITTIFSPTALSSPDGKFNFTFTMTERSTLPPLINALEVYTDVENLLLETHQDEVSAMMNIKKTYGLMNKNISWQGDPCSPKIYRWKGVKCLYLNSDQPRIVSLYLAASDLNGAITPDIAGLTQLRELDLSKNDLSGELPDFLADMKLLTFICFFTTFLSSCLKGILNFPTITFFLGSFPINDCSIDEKLGRKFPLVAVTVSVVAGVITLLAIFTICFIVARKKRSEGIFMGSGLNTIPSNINSETRSTNQSIRTKERIFTYSEILKMTNNFERVLGKGGYGRVYYGNLNGTQVAVKMLFHTTAAHDYNHFKAEVEFLSRVHHRNLVGLVGYCDDGDNLALIYQYMANGDLKENMSGKSGGHVLTWENRLLIAMEAAQGLEYLHNGSVPPMVHRDVKSTNILLNELFEAKLADFGLSRSCPVDGETSESTVVVAGTPGYLDPEYYITNLLTEKSDVYSFGVVLLEIITNQAVIDTTRERSHITNWVRFMIRKGNIENIIDPKLMGDFDTNGVWKAIELAMTCVNPTSNRRPTMPHVVMELSKCLESEISRKQGSQVMCFEDSIDFNLSPGSESPPRPRTQHQNSKYMQFQLIWAMLSRANSCSKPKHEAVEKGRQNNNRQ
ncbi:BnaA06g02030D [Brassica napus]|uniref:BnaA06g02030D protein n=1 Tax=Brassica napus TaxID=3708 RepID=A0A078GC05_BRANA|nr:BnaA06g02030D [Brassica napus]